MNLKRAAVLALNLLGVVVLIYFAVPFLMHDTTVPNPDAMIPMARWEGSGFALTAGILPLLFANALAYLLLRGIKGKQRRFLLCFLPAALCAVLASVYWIGSLTFWAT